VDAKTIEKVLIVPDENEAFDLLKTVESVPKNCRYALTLNFGQYFPAPSCRSYSVHPGKSVTHFLQVNAIFKQVLKQQYFIIRSFTFQTSLGELLEKYQIECKSLKISLEETTNELNDCVKQRIDHDKEFSQLEQTIKELNGKCARLEANVYTEIFFSNTKFCKILCLN